MKKVLLVSKFREILFAQREWIKTEFPGTNILEAANAEDAWVKFFNERPDIIVTGNIFALPMTGSELAVKIREVAPKTQLVLLSADAFLSDSEARLFDVVIDKGKNSAAKTFRDSLKKLMEQV